MRSSCCAVTRRTAAVKTYTFTTTTCRAIYEPKLPQATPRAAHRQHLLDGYLQTLYSQAAEPRCLDSSCLSGIKAATQQQSGESQTTAASGDLQASGSRLRSGNTSRQSHQEAVGSPEPAEELFVNLQEAKNPGRLDFEVMYRSLAHWRSLHLSCHVPRNCFDSPPLLSAWVRYIRRQESKGQLAAWQRDRLNLLGFEWRMDDATAKWIDMYHQLRKFKAIYGHTSVQQAVHDYDVRPGLAQSRKLGKWLTLQATDLAHGKLTEQQKQMLAMVGVQTAISPEAVQKIAQLQGMNAHERKLQRRRFKRVAAANPARPAFSATASRPTRFLLRLRSTADR